MESRSYFVTKVGSNKILKGGRSEKAATLPVPVCLTETASSVRLTSLAIWELQTQVTIMIFKWLGDLHT